MVDIEQIWLTLSRNLPVLSGTITMTETEDDFFKVWEEVDKLGLAEILCEILRSELQSAIRDKIVPLFWSHFPVRVEMNHYDVDSQFKLFHRFAAAIENLQKSFICLELFSRRVINLSPHTNLKTWDLKTVLLETLLAQIPTGLDEAVFAFYQVSFQIYIQLHTKGKAAFSEADIVLKKQECCGCKNKISLCECQTLDETIDKTNKALQEIGLLDGIAGQSLTSLVQKCIEEHIKDTCHGIFDRSFLRQLETWLDDTVINWLRKIFSHTHGDSHTNTINVIKGFKVKLTYFLYENVALSTIEQFFSIIIVGGYEEVIWRLRFFHGYGSNASNMIPRILCYCTFSVRGTLDFPESIPAIDDLKICMEKIDMKKHFIQTLTNTLKVRVLHPGVNTMDILTGYIAAIKAIRYLDNSGIILETVTAPIRDYLRKRSDTVRRVVTGLTEEGPTDLTEELAKSEALKENEKLDVNEELSNWENWLPDSYGIDQTTRIKLTNVNRSADIISMVVDIYGSKELFMNEYRNLMADRLLTYLDFNADKEIRNLELLKLRFGDSLLHSCEVMLKDLTDSKRINSHISSDSKYNDNFPESIPAIDDLKICMEKIDMKKHFIQTLTNTLKVRVLHPGVNTMDILTGYIAAIKAIRYLDNSGIILETVTAPIRDYLRKRSDTVRRVVTGLTEEGPTDLTEELAKSEALKENEKLDVNEELSNWENWLPDSYGIDQTTRIKLTNVNRSADIISMVVDIYGSKELFMNEYRNLMADRLLTYLDFNADKEIRNLELLKLRFGDSLLHSCEVMLKDLTDSKRINSHISSDSKYNDSECLI